MAAYYGTTVRACLSVHGDVLCRTAGAAIDCQYSWAMYAPFFGLRQDPFSIAPDPHYLFMSERHREALAHLLYGLDGGGGFVLLTGEIGTGKTTVCRCFLEQIPAHCNIAYIVNPKLSATELVQSVCEEFGIVPAHTAQHGESVKHWTGLLNTFLLQAHADGRNCVLIIDEAQLLSADVLEQLRLLTNLETSERKLLQIILIGQPELRGMLARPELEQLAQRVIARFHLDALSADETAQYITHRLAVAGGSGPVPFDAAALQLVHRLARGVPRRINLLCGRAMLGAYASGQHTIHRATVLRAAREVFVPDAAGAAAPGGRSRWSHPALWALGGAAAVGLAVWGLQGFAAPPIAAWRATAPAAAPLVVASSAAPVAAPAPAARPVLDAASLAAVLPTLLRDENAAWRALAPRWAAPEVDGNTDPCGAWQADNLQCFNSSRTSLALIRQLDRPGILALAGPNGQKVFAVLQGLDGDNALLDIGGVPHAVPLDTLAGVWRGDFATLWRAPPGYPGARAASRSPVVAQWLDTQLGTLPGAGADGAAKAGTLASRIYQFQLAQGLTPDGKVGPMTFMQLNRALGLNEPHLQATPSVPSTAPAAPQPAPPQAGE